jgi:FkbM family methyltransferase
MHRSCLKIILADYFNCLEHTPGGDMSPSLKSMIWKNKRSFHNDILYTRINKKGFKPEHVAEVGVYLPETSNVYGWIMEDIKATLVEANPKYVEAIRNCFAGKSKVTVISKAVFDKRGTMTLYQRDSSTFIGELPSSPAVINDHYFLEDKDKIEVETVLFSDIDDGTIDLLSIDIEGSDWFVLKHMISRPKIISVETHGKKYKNPYLSNIHEFMNNNNYRAWYQDRSDTVYFRKGLFKISFMERVLLAFFGTFPRLRY